MNRGGKSVPAFAAALQRYVDARNAALITARRSLQINELDARALLYIADNHGTRPGRLRDFLGITSAGVTTLIDRLVERRAVRRDVDAEDRRVNRITVTVDLNAEPWNALTRFDHDFRAALDAAEIDDADRFARDLDRLTAAASGMPPA